MHLSYPITGMRGSSTKNKNENEADNAVGGVVATIITATHSECDE